MELPPFFGIIMAFLLGILFGIGWESGWTWHIGETAPERVGVLLCPDEIKPEVGNTYSCWVVSKP